MVLRVLKLSILTMCAAALITTGVSAASISLRPNATWMERAAAGDLQRVIYAATGKRLPIQSSKQGDPETIALGFSPAPGVDLSRKTLGDQGFVLKTIKHGGKTLLVAAGATPVATTYAAYTLAESYGAGFYLGGDALPREKRAFSIPNLNMLKKPALAIRGVLPWYNFFDSPTAWNIEDYRSFIDQLAKTKNNFLGFHSYDAEPFCAYKNKEGKLTAGAPLISSAGMTWGTLPMKTADFAAGTGKYFDKEYFGADCSMGYKTPEEGVTHAKKLLADALAYAKARGLKTCVGFEVGGDPTISATLDELELRLKNLVQTYPTLDYVWIWEPEALGTRGTDVRAARSDLGAYYRRFSDAFSDIKEPKRKTEAVRMTIYALAAHRILQREAPRVKMIVSGWGGDNHLHFTDFYPGMDKVLPKDIIFSSLDNIVVSDTVSSAYAKLSKDREFWPIPWFEYDGDQWFAQPNTKRFVGAAKDALKKGAKGLLGIHWRTRDVEESHAFVSEFAWNPELSYEGFYRDYATRAFGAEKAASLLMGLQDLGYRWVGGPGQTECGRFLWKMGRDEGIKDLNTLFGKYDNLPWSDRLEYLRATRNWVEAYEEAARILRFGGAVEYTLSFRNNNNLKCPPEEAKGLSQDLNEGIKACEKAVLTYARRVSNRGELGVLATINTKAWANTLAMGKIAEKVADAQIRTNQVFDEGPLNVKSILRLNTVFAGEPFRISALVHGTGSPVKAEVVYRAPGKEWNTAKLRCVNLGRLEGAIPASAVTGDLLEYFIRVDLNGATTTWPGDGVKNNAFVSVVPRPAVAAPRVQSPAKSAVPVGKITCAQGPILLQLKWQDAPGVRVFQVMRQDGAESKWHAIASTRDPWFEDRKVAVGLRYRYQVLDSDSNRKLAESSAVLVAEPPTPPTPQVEAANGAGRIRLRWPADSVAALGFRVYRSESPDGPFTALDKVKPLLSPTGLCTCACPAEPDQAFFYHVRAFSKPGKEGPPSKPVMAVAYSPDAEPILKLNFEGRDSGVTSDYVIENGVRAARVGAGAKEIKVPYSDELNLADEISIEFWVKLLKPGTMPVLVSRGYWNSDGYFVQYFNGQVRFFLAGVGTLDAGKLDIGRWTHVAATYDGAEMVTYINGKAAGSIGAAGPIRSSNRSLYIGRYDDESRDFEADGYFTDVRLYPYALPAEKIKTDYDQTAIMLRK